MNTRSQQSRGSNTADVCATNENNTTQEYNKSMKKSGRGRQAKKLSVNSTMMMSEADQDSAINKEHKTETQNFEGTNSKKRKLSEITGGEHDGSAPHSQNGQQVLPKMSSKRNKLHADSDCLGDEEQRCSQSGAKISFSKGQISVSPRLNAFFSKGKNTDQAPLTSNEEAEMKPVILEAATDNQDEHQDATRDSEVLDGPKNQSEPEATIEEAHLQEMNLAQEGKSDEVHSEIANVQVEAQQEEEAVQNEQPQVEASAENFAVPEQLIEQTEEQPKNQEQALETEVVPVQTEEQPVGEPVQEHLVEEAKDNVPQDHPLQEEVQTNSQRDVTEEAPQDESAQPDAEPVLTEQAQEQ